MTFPYHTVPDANAALPHHYYTALLLALVPVLIVWDNQRKSEPWLALVGIVGGLFSFGMVWPRYPVVGAVLALVANAVVVLAPFRPGWRQWPRRHAVAVVLLALVAADDSLQHAFGWVTPIDWAWKHGGRAAVVDVFSALA